VQRRFARRLLIVQVEADQLRDDRDPNYADQSTGAQNMPNRCSPLPTFLTCSPNARHGGGNHQKTYDLQQPNVQVEAVVVRLDVVVQNRVQGTSAATRRTLMTSNSLPASVEGWRYFRRNNAETGHRTTTISSIAIDPQSNERFKTEDFQAGTGRKIELGSSLL
jgi:hypothetical protein